MLHILNHSKRRQKTILAIIPFSHYKINIYFHCKMYNGKGTWGTTEIAAAIFIPFVTRSLGERQFSLHHDLWDEGTPCEWEHCWLVWHFLRHISPADELAVSRKEGEFSFKEPVCSKKVIAIFFPHSTQVDSGNQMTWWEPRAWLKNFRTLGMGLGQ